MARVALDAYGFTDARFKLLTWSDDIHFRVDAPSLAPVKMANELYFDYRFVLRIHQLGYQTAESIASQIEWLSALRR